MADGRGGGGESKTACRPPRDYAARPIIYINTVLSCWSRRCVCARVRVCSRVAYRIGRGECTPHIHTSARARCTVGAAGRGRRRHGARRGVGGVGGKRVIDTKPTAPALLAGPCQIIHTGEGTAPNPEFYFCTTDNRSRAHSSHVPSVRFYVVVIHTQTHYSRSVSVASRPPPPSHRPSQNRISRVAVFPFVFNSSSPWSGDGTRSRVPLPLLCLP